MASGKTHAVTGGAVGLGIYGVYKWQKREDWTLLGAAGAVAVGMIIALLPDIIESAVRNPNHRQFFHSATVLATTCLAYNKIGRNELEKNALNIGLGGYISHLVLDAFTPRSLPIV